MRRPALLACAAFVLCAPAAASAQERVGVRVGTHPTHGRVVFDWPRAVEYRAERQGDRLLLRFDAPDGIDLSGARRPPRNVAGVAGTEDGVEITLRPGARVRHFRLGSWVVVDVLDPEARARAPAQAPSQPEAARRSARPGRPGQPEASGQAARAGSPPPAPPLPEIAPAPAPPRTEPAAAPTAVPEPQRTPVAATAAPPATPVAAVPAARPEPQTLPVRLAVPGRAISVAVGEGVGAAVFRRGDAVLVVFDAARPLDLAALRRDPVFAAAETWTTVDATVLRLPLAAPAELRPRREGLATWGLEAVREAPPPAQAVASEIEPGPPARLVLRTVRPGRSVTLADPDTGAPMLVGTLLEAGQGVPLGRRTPQFDLLPTGLGAAVLARADSLVLRPGADRFTLAAAAGGAEIALGASLGREPAPEAAGMSRVMDLPTLAPAALSERLRGQSATVAATPPLARGPARRDAAETLLGLGLAQEAQAMAALALQEDPRAAADPRTVLAHGAAALLAGRPAEARGIDDPRLPETDETTFWRGMLAAARGETRVAAQRLAASAPLLLGYPEALRVRLLPLAAETLMEGGEPGAAARLLAAVPNGAAGSDALGFARARLAEAEGRAEEALEGYDAVVRGRDRLARARALRRAIELRLATGRLDAAGAAAAMEASLFAWRGDAEEESARRRLAELKRRAGDPRGAFLLLRETQSLFPAGAAALRPAVAEALAEAVETEAPAAAVALFDAHRDLLPGGERGEALVATIAERLLALDLPGRAAQLLQAAAERAPAGSAARAGLGARLATLRLGEGDAAGALAALAATEAAGLSASLSAERGVLQARALARGGEFARAAESLRGLGAAGAVPLSELLAERQDWAGAAAALSEHLAAVLPPAPAPLAVEDRRALARLAAFTALAGDEPRLAALRAAHGGRMQGGPLGEVFTLLTADPVRGLADLPRLQRELGPIRAAPARLEALRAGAPVTR